MKNKRLDLIALVSALLLLLLAVIAESVYFSDIEYRLHTKRVNRIITEKERIIDNCMTGLRMILARGGSPQTVSVSSIYATAEKNHITLLEYMDGKLVYWSDNSFDVPLMLDNSLFSKPLVFIQNGWFITGNIEGGNEKIIGLLRVRTDYGFENNIVRNGFEKDFNLPANTSLSTEKSPDGYNVFNREGNFLFSLAFPEEKSNTYLIIIPILLWIGVFVLFIFLVIRRVSSLTEKGKGILAFVSVFFLFSIIYLLVLITGKPEVIFRTDLFSAYNFSLNKFIPSLGHLLLLSMLSSVLGYVFYGYFPLRSDVSKPVRDFLMTALTFGFSALLLSLINNIFTSLISDSNINFETYKVLKLSFLSIAGFVSILLLLLVPLFLIIKISVTCRENEGSKRLISTLIALLVIVAFLNYDPVSLAVVSGLFISMITLIWLAVKRNLSNFNLSVIFSILFGIYSLYTITVFSEKKTNENLKVQSFSFSTDNDPVAEHLLLDLWPKLTGDTILKRMMSVTQFQGEDYDNIYNYLREKYFSEYWGNFSFNIFLCRSDQPIEIGVPGSEEFVSCFTFFDDRIRRYGTSLTGTGFYFIDDQGGRSNYLGREFYSQDDGFVNGLFIELLSDVDVFQPGYSELLLDKKFRGYSGLKDYSFAKYINGEIVIKNGDFAYNKNDEDYIDKNSDYRLFRDEGFIHSLYRNGNATIIISRPEIGIGNLVISFAYLFIFIFMFSNLFVLAIQPPSVREVINLNFRQKLQASFIGILLGSFILTGVVVAFLTIWQYKAEHSNNIREKLGSVYLELESRIATQNYLSADWKNNTYASLNELLINLSNIFNTDINLYDLNGFLIATSRPEIFYRDLSARRMDNLAFINLRDLKKSEYIQNERLGNMSYISAYVPFYNAEDKVLAYVNLPYFKMQSLLARQISNLVVAVINFTLLVILLAMGFAVFISRRLTSPLLMLGQGLASVELGKKAKHLTYRGNDEIGELVKQYNRMVEELDDSAMKLANSEREYAWREMAKQIAHEIKNPLTPMKLNVQQLLKSWKDGVPGFEKKLEGFTRNQIEYIDNLSTIASAFSSFAKMPGSNPAVVNLIEQIKLTLELFRNTENVSFRVRWPHESKIFIFADKEHLNGIFSNLFKNSIQSIPQDREGLIRVELETRGDKVIVSVTDNGSGIPEDLRKKIFTPNFTTKSSGMGLGLSIVKKYVEGINGKIWFESAAENGTTFFIEFPLMYTIEKPGEA